MLKNDFIPVAIDQWYQRRQTDGEGDFYRKIAGQGPRNNFELTTQGRYICAPDGTLLGYNNNRGPDRLKEVMEKAKDRYESESFAAKPIDSKKPDPNRLAPPPADTVIIRVNSKVLSGYKPTKEWTGVFHDAIGRDNLWLLKDEIPELVELAKAGGKFPDRIARRIARFHLVDNTRGEPPRWSNSEIRNLEMAIDKQGTIRGQVHLETESGDRGYVADLFGILKTADDSLSQFDLVAKGDFWGRGRHTYHPPEGKFPVAIAFRMAFGKDPADGIMPHGTKGWPQGYYESER